MPILKSYTVRGQTGYRFRFTCPDTGKRANLRVGVVSKATAEEVGRAIDVILEHTKYNRDLPPGLCEWLSGVDDSVYALFVQAGLLQPRAATSHTMLKCFLEAYVATKEGGSGRTGGWKATTQKSRAQSVSDLVLHFGAERSLADITAGEAEDWHLWLQRPKPKGRGLSAATAAKRLKDARQFFRYGVRRKLIEENPFEGMRVPSQENPERLVEVPRATIDKLLTSIDDPELALVVALARFTGFRVPSEVSNLRWRDVDLARGELHVFAPKTEHHAGGGRRICPLPAELRPLIEAVRPEAADPAAYVLVRRRGANTNLRTALERELKSARIPPWPKLFQNLRANALTDLAEHYPIHIVCKWLGNTIDVAMRHYVIIKRREYRGPEPTISPEGPGASE